MKSLRPFDRGSERAGLLAGSGTAGDTVQGVIIIIIIIVVVGRFSVLRGVLYGVIFIVVARFQIPQDAFRSRGHHSGGTLRHDFRR